MNPSGRRKPEGFIDGFVYDISKVVVAPVWWAGGKYIWRLVLSPVVAAIADVNEESVKRDAEKRVVELSDIDNLMQYLVDATYDALVKAGTGNKRRSL